MKLADKIMRADDGTLTSHELARQLGCTASYVRTVRQRWGGLSANDMRYIDKRKKQRDLIGQE